MELSRAERFGQRLRSALKRANVTGGAFAGDMGVNRVTVSNWLNGHFMPGEARIAEIESYLAEHGVTVALDLAGEAAPDISPIPLPPVGNAGWPDGWRARTYRLMLEATEAGATEEEVAVVRGWMMDPQLQALWSGGAPTDLRELDGIETGARAWLRERGRKVAKGAGAGAG